MVLPDLASVCSLGQALILTAQLQTRSCTFLRQRDGQVKNLHLNRFPQIRPLAASAQWGST